MMTKVKNTKLEDWIEAEALKEYPYDVDNVGVNEAGFEILRDANKDDREIFEAGIRIGLTYSSEGVEKMREEITHTINILTDYVSRFDFVPEEIHERIARLKEALAAAKLI